MSSRRSIEQQRMNFAFEHSKNAENAKKYEAYIQKIPAFIMTNGLGNTIAYMATQSNVNWKKVGQNICDWLLEVNNPLKEKLAAKKQNDAVTTIDLLDVLKDCSQSEYKSVTIEILALFNWLRRFAKTHKNNK